MPQNSLSNLTSIPPFDYRVPHSTIELHVIPSYEIDNQDLSWVLLTEIEFIGEHLRRKGDGPLAPKHDPFGIVSSSRVSFIAQSVPGTLMTWAVIQIAVEGLYWSLPGSGKSYGARFQIRDYQHDFQWGSGEIKTLPPDIPTPTPNIVAIKDDTSSAWVTESAASTAVVAA